MRLKNFRKFNICYTLKNGIFINNITIYGLVRAVETRIRLFNFLIFTDIKIMSCYAEDRLLNLNGKKSHITHQMTDSMFILHSTVDSFSF